MTRRPGVRLHTYTHTHMHASNLRPACMRGDVLVQVVASERRRMFKASDGEERDQWVEAVNEALMNARADSGGASAAPPKTLMMM